MHNLYFDNRMPFRQIGTDGGPLDAPVMLSRLFIAPGECVDVSVDDHEDNEMMRPFAVIRSVGPAQPGDGG